MLVNSVDKDFWGIYTVHMEDVNHKLEQAGRLTARARDITAQRNQAISQLVHVHHVTLRAIRDATGLSPEAIRRIANRTPQETT